MTQQRRSKPSRCTVDMMLHQRTNKKGEASITTPIILYVKLNLSSASRAVSRPLRVCGLKIGSLGGPDAGLEDKELWVWPTEEDYSAVFSYITHLRPPSSFTSLYLNPSHTKTWAHTQGVAITLSTDSDDPGCLTQKPLCYVPLSPILLRERGRWWQRRELGTQSKNGSTSLRSLPIRMLLKACPSITVNHTELGCSWV